MRRSSSDLIKNVEHFVQIDLDLKKNATINNIHYKVSYRICIYYS